MNISFTPSINFNAKCVKSPQIGYKKPLETDCSSIRSSIVEIDIRNSQNIQALKKAVESWGEKDFYGKEIIDSVKTQLKKGTKTNSKIYALTLQKENFNILDWSQILGLSEVSRKGKKKIEIDFLQVMPKIAGKNTDKQYFDVGSSIVRMLQWKPENTHIMAKADYRAANFYEKMNFEIISPNRLIYVWKRLKGVKLPKH